MVATIDIKDIRTNGFLSHIWGRVTYKTHSFEVAPDALKGYFPYAAGGTYELAFTDLFEESRDLEAMPLHEMVSRLKEKQGKGDQNIEVVGLKLPNQEVNRWGILLLLSVQFYFWLRLHELNKKIDATSPGWDVAWIGIYSSLPAIVTMWISAGALPVAAIGLMVLRNPVVGQKHVHLQRILAGLIILVSVVLVIATIERLHVLKIGRTAELDQHASGISKPLVT